MIQVRLTEQDLIEALYLAQTPAFHFLQTITLLQYKNCVSWTTHQVFHHCHLYARASVPRRAEAVDKIRSVLLCIQSPAPDTISILAVSSAGFPRGRRCTHRQDASSPAAVPPALLRLQD